MPSGLRVVCGCIHGRALSVHRDVLIDVYSCMCAECAVSGWKTLSRAASLPYMKTVRYSYLTFTQTLLVTITLLWPSIPTGNVVEYMLYD